MAREFVFLKKCNEDWHEMAGSASARFCGECQRTVVNLSALTRREAEKIVEGLFCGRLLTDATGRPTFRGEVDFGPLRRMCQISALGAAASGGAVAQPVSGTCEVKVRVSDISQAGAQGARVTVREPNSPVSIVI